MDAGTEVKPARPANIDLANQSLQQEVTFTHYAFLGAVYADSPAQRKMSRFQSFSGGLGCGRCKLRAISSAGMKYLGYVVPVPCGMTAPSMSFTLRG